MHELAICQALMEQVNAIAKQRGASGVSSITVRIGPLSGVEPDLLLRAFPVASAGSRADGARLNLERLPVRVDCAECGQAAEVPVNRLSCPTCGNLRTRLLSGDELLLAQLSLEIESDENRPLAETEQAHV